jgi:hypothetical protein
VRRAHRPGPEHRQHPGRCSGLLGFVLLFVVGTWIVYYQSELYQVWAQYGSPTEGTPV